MRFRPADAAELEALLQVHRIAFGRDDEAALVARLLADPSAQPALSIVAEAAGRIVGHALFTALNLVGVAPDPRCSLLAPLAVVPAHQGAGVGRGLIEHGCNLLAERGVGPVFVLGDPGYYARCDFVRALRHDLHAPYAIDLPAAWMVRPLRAGLLGTVRGELQCARTLAAETYWRE